MGLLQKCLMVPDMHFPPSGKRKKRNSPVGLRYTLVPAESKGGWSSSRSWSQLSFLVVHYCEYCTDIHCLLVQRKPKQDFCHRRCSAGRKRSKKINKQDNFLEIYFLRKEIRCRKKGVRERNHYLFCSCVPERASKLLHVFVDLFSFVLFCFFVS